MADENGNGVTEDQKDAYEAAGSYQRELQSDIEGELMGTQNPPDHRRDDRQSKKEGVETAGTNPKRGENSRPD